MNEQKQAIRIDFLPKLKDPLMIVAFRGWNDGGKASTNAVRRMISQFNAQRFATIDPEEFYVFSESRPKVKLVDGQTRREIQWQKNEFYHAELPGGGRDVVLFLGTEPNLKWRTFGMVFTSLAQQLGVNCVVTLGAYLADVLYTLPIQVNGFSSDLQLMADHKLERTNYEGPTGIVGVLNSFAQEQKFKTLSLWAAVPYYISIPNPKAVHAIMRKLGEVFAIEFDLNTLEKDADNFDNEINDVVAKDPNVAAYVRELKKREFLN
ncbi:MAG: PAC2 family protein [SAR324 cluster bacterium]|nr:PAC2 family protein [SAR324 cluster bacterium]